MMTTNFEIKDRKIPFKKDNAVFQTKMIKVTVTSIADGNFSNGLGKNWDSALKDAINNFKIKYGHKTDLAILID